MDAPKPKWEDVTPEKIISDLQKIYDDAIAARNREIEIHNVYNTYMQVLYKHNMGFDDSVELLEHVGTLCDLLSPSGAKQAINSLLNIIQKG